MTRWDAGRGFAGGVRGTRAAAPPTNGRRYECGDRAGCGFAGGVQGAAPVRRFAPALPHAERAKWGWGVNRWERHPSFAMQGRRSFGHKKTAPGREPIGRLDAGRKRQKKKQPLTVTHIRFFTQSRATSPCSWYLTSWLPLFLQIFCCCVVSGTRNRQFLWVLFPVLKSEACFWPSFPAGASPAASAGSRSADLSYMLNGPSSFVTII